MVPLKIDYKNYEEHPDLQPLVEEQVEKLEKYFNRMTSCHVVISKPHHHHQNGHSYHVHLDVHVPGNVIAINREPEKNERHEEIEPAIRDAFKIAKRKLQEYSDRLRNEVKNHH
jgi:ribosomal subunit interface protein